MFDRPRSRFIYCCFINTAIFFPSPRVVHFWSLLYGLLERRDKTIFFLYRSFHEIEKPQVQYRLRIDYIIFRLISNKSIMTLEKLMVHQKIVIEHENN